MKKLSKEEIEARLTPGNENYRDFRGCELSKAKLSGADSRGANLYEPNLTRVNLIRASVIAVNLSEYDFDGANLTEADIKSIIKLPEKE